MFTKIKNITLTVLFSALLTFTPSFAADNNSAISTTPLNVVAAPQKYLNKTVTMKATFDKFSTLGLDYKKAMRSSSDYIGFLIQRDDVVDHNVPLSEMKLFIKRDYAEKFIELDTGDKIQITGKVFSNALGDPWIDINKITILQKKANPDKDKK
ncbi:TPA: hypothetical protein IAA86_06160 [Candidatus Galligastranaerophilus intestinavium]|uniref:Bacterial OB-fold domain-containing protein n=1 Tax=Candidatus Galligastranaerophilus intestinavium TaxID=2840836 RepID=A0A9D1JXW6_9BACT|nr:hypothetical protein [Candidatus Galligastranaerophilus intestinavium]